MAEELLVGDRLTAEMIDSGAKLVDALDKLNVTVKGAFWLLLPDRRVWRLLIAMPEVRLAGPKAMYRKIRSAIEKLPADVEPVGTKDISVIDDKAPLLSLLREAVSPVPGIDGIRFSRNVVNGQLIEDAYLYRIV